MHSPRDLCKVNTKQAKVLASLNNRDIAAIYGIEEACGIRTLVMADRIGRVSDATGGRKVAFQRLVMIGRLLVPDPQAVVDIKAPEARRPRNGDRTQKSKHSSLSASYRMSPRGLFSSRGVDVERCPYFTCLRNCGRIATVIAN